MVRSPVGSVTQSYCILGQGLVEPIRKLLLNPVDPRCVADPQHQFRQIEFAIGGVRL